jgi:hypothetical protein
MSRPEVVDVVKMCAKGEAEKKAYHHVIDHLFEENVPATEFLMNFVILLLTHTPSLVTTSAH